jgi:hypothetical protein
MGARGTHLFVDAEMAGNLLLRVAVLDVRA